MKKMSLVLAAMMAISLFLPGMALAGENLFFTARGKSDGHHSSR